MRQVAQEHRRVAKEIAADERGAGDAGASAAGGARERSASAKRKRTRRGSWPTRSSARSGWRHVPVASSPSAASRTIAGELVG